MSYILDALKKSEKERKIGQVPTLHSIESEELAPTSKLFPILLVTIIILLLVVLALLYFQPMKVETEMLIEHVNSGAVHEESVEIIEVKSLVGPITESQDIMEVMMQDQARKQQMKKEVVSVPIRTEAIPEQFNEELLKDGEILITPTSRREAKEATVKEVFATPDDTPVPLLSETEYDFQTQLPAMHLDVHVYKSHRKDRFVLINMDKYREGQKMPSGIVIEAIVVEGVMMNYQGRRFLLPLD